MPLQLLCSASMSRIEGLSEGSFCGLEDDVHVAIFSSRFKFKYQFEIALRRIAGISIEIIAHNHLLKN